METHTRTIAKTLSWRILATVITACIVGGITGQIELGLSAGVLDCSIKILVYYFHERFWSRLKFGYVEKITS